MDGISGKRNIIILALLFLVGVFIAWNAHRIKVTSTNRRISSIKRALEKEQKDDVREKLLAQLKEIEKGNSGEHDHEDEDCSVCGGDHSDDFFHQDFFNSPWRNWQSSYILWGMAQHVYLCFFILTVLKSFYDEKRQRSRRRIKKDG